ncbi:MAG: Na+/H+ antiporter subunit E [Holophagales bacterium]|nr:Na+/H+ antiporter subunit E [Holophagales bacterium]
MTSTGKNARGNSRTGKKKKEARRAAVHLCIVVSGLWIFWSGHLSVDHPLLAGLGVVSLVLVLWLCTRMGIVDSDLMPLHLTFRTLRYVPWLGWQVILSSLEVLRRSISLDVSPTVVTVEGFQKTDLGLVSYANSITLTPGTTSLDSDAETHAITVHAISEEGAATLREGAMDRWVYWVENGSWPEEGAGAGQVAPAASEDQR